MIDYGIIKGRLAGPVFPADHLHHFPVLLVRFTSFFLLYPLEIMLFFLFFLPPYPPRLTRYLQHPHGTPAD